MFIHTYILATFRRCTVWRFWPPNAVIRVCKYAYKYIDMHVCMFACQAGDSLTSQFIRSTCELSLFFCAKCVAIRILKKGLRGEKNGTMKCGGMVLRMDWMDERNDGNGVG